LELKYGERMNQAKKEGIEGHESDLEFLTPVKTEKIWKEAIR